MQVRSHMSVLVHDLAKKYGEREALIYQDFGGKEWKSLSWNKFSATVKQVSNALLNIGVKEQENIGIFSQNSIQYLFCDFGAWGVRAVTIPFYATSSEQQIQFMINDAKVSFLFVGEQEQYDRARRVVSLCPTLERIIVYDAMVHISEHDTNAIYFDDFLKLGDKLPRQTEVEQRQREANNDDIANILYTSGTTGFSKGVMIPYRALWGNADFAENVLGKKIKPGDSVISILPMAHMYGMAFEFIFEFIKGCHVFYLTRIPSPAIIAEAFGRIKPAVIIAVPLVIEKIIRKKVFPKIQNNRMRMLLHMPVISKKVKEKICDQVTNAFGGNFYEVIIGGAAFNQEVESFLHSVGFKYTVGYGATECAPIICYEDYKNFVPGSCGKAALHMMVRIDSPDPENVPGEILAKGPNVMLGYYKNEEATKQTIDENGWYHTGDLGTMDGDGNVFIKGRSKNMLLGANGQNIYPEEIEDKLNSLALVAESVVVQKGDKLIALVHPDYDEAQTLNLGANELADVMEQNRQELNTMIPAYSKVSEIRIHEDEFEKTPKKSIKRFLYTAE